MATISTSREDRKDTDNSQTTLLRFVFGSLAIWIVSPVLGELGAYAVRIFLHTYCK